MSAYEFVCAQTSCLIRRQKRETVEFGSRLPQQLCGGSERALVQCKVMYDSAMIKIGEGETAEVFRLEPGKVVKLFRKEFYEEAYFLTEFETARAVGEQTTLAPKVLDRVQMEGRTGYVMEEVQGTLFQREIDANPDRLEHHARLLGHAQRALHDNAETRGLDHIPQFKPYFESFYSSIPHFSQDVRDWLNSILIGLPDDAALLHGDFMPYNMFLSDGRVQVIDWAEPVYGPPMAGVARTLHFIVDPTERPDSVYTKSAQAFIDHYLDAYSERKTIDRDLLHRCSLLNAASEYSWAMRSRQNDRFVDRIEKFILSNFERYASDTLFSF